METGFGRTDTGRYRWRGDGLLHEAPSVDYLHGASGESGGLRDGAEEWESTTDRRQQTVDSRLIHWDLFDTDDERSRTA